MFIREMEAFDLMEVTSLCEQFGYAATFAQIQMRFEQIESNSTHAIFVAVNERGSVIGWIHVFSRMSLGSDLSAEIGGIVVDREARQSGVGRALMEQAERWSKQNGLTTVRLRSGISRPEAHEFYPRVGYDRTKTQHVYVKKL